MTVKKQLGVELALYSFHEAWDHQSWTKITMRSKWRRIALKWCSWYFACGAEWVKHGRLKIKVNGTSQIILHVSIEKIIMLDSHWLNQSGSISLNRHMDIFFFIAKTKFKRLAGWRQCHCTRKATSKHIFGLQCSIIVCWARQAQCLKSSLLDLSGVLSNQLEAGKSGNRLTVLGKRRTKEP